MATWIEIRCEERGPGDSYAERCWSDDNSGPMEMAADDNESIPSVMRELREDAVKWPASGEYRIAFTRMLANMLTHTVADL